MIVNINIITPIVPHKAAAEVSKVGTIGEVSCYDGMDGRANPLMDRKVVGVVLFGMVAVVTSPTTAGCSAVQCSTVEL